MKSKLIAALAAAVCVLAESPANAVSVTSHPGAITTSVPGAVLFDDFDSIQNTAIGTITGGVLNLGSAPTTRHREFHRSATLALLGERRTPKTRSMYIMVLLCSAHSLA
jgi:hypothetical protein